MSDSVRRICGIIRIGFFNFSGFRNNNRVCCADNITNLGFGFGNLVDGDVAGYGIDPEQGIFASKVALLAALP